jgi:hypothetical protein
VLVDRGRPHWPRWWTRERVLSGLSRFYLETGQAPTGCKQYRRLVAGLDGGKKRAERRYPSEYAIYLYWPSLAEAWRAAGIVVYGQVELLIPASAEGRGYGKPRPRGERHGRLIVLEFAGYKQRKRHRASLWRCLCDCGRERIVEGDQLRVRRECRECGAGRLREARVRSIARACEESARVRRRRATAPVQASAPLPSLQEQA